MSRPSHPQQWTQPPPLASSFMCASPSSWPSSRASWPSPPCPYPTAPWVWPSAPSPHAPSSLGPRPPAQAQARLASGSVVSFQFTPTNVPTSVHTLYLSSLSDQWYMDMVPPLIVANGGILLSNFNLSLIILLLAIVILFQLRVLDILSYQILLPLYL